MKKQLIWVISAFMLVVTAGVANAFTIDTVNGQWTGTSGGNSDLISGLGTNLLTWGDDNISSLEFIGSTDLALDDGNTFLLGTLTHSNGNNAIGTSPSAADLIVNLSFSDPEDLNETFQFTLDIDSTINSATPVTNAANNDMISIETFEIEGVAYTLELMGFGLDENSLLPSLDTTETVSNATQLWATVHSNYAIAGNNAVPIPGSIILLGSGLFGFCGLIRRKKQP